MGGGDPLSGIVACALGKLERTLPTAYQRESALKKAGGGDGAATAAGGVRTAGLLGGALPMQ
jgi:hypothetical protein